MAEESYALGKYVLNQKAYMPQSPGLDHVMLEAGAEVYTDLKPGPHMDPLDDAARANKAKAGPQSLDFSRFVPMNGGSDDDLLADRVATAVAKALATVLPMLGAAAPAAPAPVPEPAAAPAPIAPVALAAPPPPPPPPPPRR